MRWVLALGLLACAACTEPADRRTGVSASPLAAPTTSQAPTPSVTSATPTVAASPTVTPAAEVTLRIARTKRGADGGVTWTAQVPVLSGLAPDATARANAVLADAVDADIDSAVSSGSSEGDTFDSTAELSAVDARYVTVHLHGYYQPLGAAHGFGGIETFVFDRATGARLRLTSFFRPGSLTGAVHAMSRVARERLPQILGPDGVMDLEAGTAPKTETYQRITPLPEGLEVMFGSYEVAPYAAGYPTVVVPWVALERYLALPPSPGPDVVPYRDGFRFTGARYAGVVKAAKAGPLDRVQESQLYGGADGWVLAQAGTKVIALRGPAHDGPWRVVPCATVPRDVRLSMMLRCGA